jgi:hypothetical protein
MAACARLLPPSRQDRRTGLGRARGLAAGRGGRPAPGHPAHPRAGQWRSRSAPAQQASPPGPRRAVRRHLRPRSGGTANRGARPGGGPGPARDVAFNRVSARRAGPVTRHRQARPRPAAMRAVWRPAVVGVALA